MISLHATRQEHSTDPPLSYPTKILFTPQMKQCLGTKQLYFHSQALALLTTSLVPVFSEPRVKASLEGITGSTGPRGLREEPGVVDVVCGEINKDVGLVWHLLWHKIKDYSCSFYGTCTMKEHFLISLL